MAYSTVKISKIEAKVLLRMHTRCQSWQPAVVGSEVIFDYQRGIYRTPQFNFVLSFQPSNMSTLT